MPPHAFLLRRGRTARRGARLFAPLCCTRLAARTLDRHPLRVGFERDDGCARRTIGRLDRLSNAAETARVERARRELNRCRRRDAAPCEAAANRFLVFVAERAIGFEDLTDDFRVREEVR